MAESTQMIDLAEQLVDAINALSGRHPGHRAAHAKGTLCSGTFTASPEAAGITRAAHMQCDPIPVTVRFSNGSGDPGTPDTDRREGRGMAIKPVVRYMILCEDWRFDPPDSTRIVIEAPEGLFELEE